MFSHLYKVNRTTFNLPNIKFHAHVELWRYHHMNTRGQHSLTDTHFHVNTLSLSLSNSQLALVFNHVQCCLHLTICRVPVSVGWAVDTTRPRHQTTLIPHRETEVTWQPSFLSSSPEQTTLTTHLQTTSSHQTSETHSQSVYFFQNEDL